MMLALRRASLLLLLPVLLPASGCDSPPPAPDDGASVCVGKPVPPAAPGFRMKLSVVDFDEQPGPSSRGWRSLGFNYDGLCSSSTHLLACKRRPGGQAAQDGDGGIDNAFGRSLIGLFVAFLPHPSASWSGGSYLELDDAGNGLLLLVDENATYRVPLRHARIEGFDGAGGMLGAIVPSAELAATLGDDAAALSTSLCGGSTRRDIDGIVIGAADIPLSGVPDPDAECDGISLGMRFRGAPVDALPPPRPNPCTADAGTDAAP